MIKAATVFLYDRDYFYRVIRFESVGFGIERNTTTNQQIANLSSLYNPGSDSVKSRPFTIIPPRPKTLLQIGQSMNLMYARSVPLSTDRKLLACSLRSIST